MQVKNLRKGVSGGGETDEKNVSSKKASSTTGLMAATGISPFP